VSLDILLERYFAELARKSAELKMQRKEENQRQKEVLLRARQLRGDHNNIKWKDL